MTKKAKDGLKLVTPADAEAAAEAASAKKRAEHLATLEPRARQIEMDRAQRENSRLEARAEFVAHEREGRWQEFVTKMKDEFAAAAGAEFDAKHPTWTFERVAEIYIKPTMHEAQRANPEIVARYVRDAADAFAQWRARNPIT